MQNSFDNAHLNPDSFDFEAYLASISVEFAEDFPINEQNPTYASPTPAEQSQTLSASAGSPSSMTPPAFETQVSDSSTSSLAIPMPQFVANPNNFGPFHPQPFAQGGNSNIQHFELQRLAESQLNLAQSTLPYSPVSPSGSAASAPALSRSSSGRRQVTPTLSDGDYDTLPLPSLPSNATTKERREHKREQNKLAARRARRRREAQVLRMENDVARLQREADIWRERARMMEGLLAKAGVNIPAFPDDI